MKDLVKLKNKKVAILGMGIEGIALAQFLHGQVGELFLLDRLSLDELLGSELGIVLKEILDKKEVKYSFGQKYLSELTSFEVIFRSPGISYNNELLTNARKSGVEISSQIKLFFELCPAKIIGVTGTKGKGTTSTLIYNILHGLKGVSGNVYLAGNIGYPAITLLPKIEEDDIVILELSSFQLMDLNVSPHIAVMTNLLVDHLDYHSNIEEYQQAKLNILRYQSEKDQAVVNWEINKTVNIEAVTKSKVMFFQKGEKSSERTKAVVKEEAKDIFGVFIEDEPLCLENELKIIGRHNLENISAAALVALLFNVPKDNIRRAVLEFKGLPHRLELVVEKNGVQYINDSFATNPLPTIAAIKAVKNNKILILGGSSKGADFAELADEITKENVSAVILIGEEGGRIEKAIVKSGFGGKILKQKGAMSEIIKTATGLSKKGDAIILSPACASFDMFKNYKDRGDRFKDGVLKQGVR